MTSLGFHYRTKTTIKKHYILYYEVCLVSNEPNFKLVIKSRSFIHFTASSFLSWWFSSGWYKSELQPKKDEAHYENKTHASHQ